MKKTLLLTFIVVITAVFLSGCALGGNKVNNGNGAEPANINAPAPENSTVTSQNKPANSSTGLANPASVNCKDKGGQLEMRKDGAGGEYGVCLFEDNQECEEWALLWDLCPEGGVKITGYATEAARYCAISGGEYQVTKEYPAVAQDKEEGNCVFKDKTCDAGAFYRGECSRWPQGQ